VPLGQLRNNFPVLAFVFDLPLVGEVARLCETVGGIASTVVKVTPPTRSSKTRSDLPHKGGGQKQDRPFEPFESGC